MLIEVDQTVQGLESDQPAFESIIYLLFYRGHEP